MVSEFHAATAPTRSGNDEETARPGSRAARMGMPVAGDALRLLAERTGVCVHPIPIRRTDLVTGQVEVIDVRPNDVVPVSNAKGLSDHPRAVHPASP